MKTTRNMPTTSHYFLFLFLLGFAVFCNTPQKKTEKSSTTLSAEDIKDEILAIKSEQEIVKKLILGAERLDYLTKKIGNKKVALLVNPTSMVGETHLVDTLLSRNVQVKKIFAPEHGFRGDRPDGEKINNSIDKKTQVPIISLYGKNKKASKENLSGIELIIFDIQDVGLRFYTYISSMHYLMEAAAENNIPIMVLDRPNPNGRFVDGPILKKEFKSFVGMHPIPVLHGMTIGEYAQMINEELWLSNSKKADLTVITMLNYNRNLPYDLPVKPSPNLPNQKAINLYASLCFFEGTVISIGRGTQFPFQVIGYPENPKGSFTFKPIKIQGMSLYPKFENKICKGIDLRNDDFSGGLSLKWLLDFYKNYPNKEKFFKPYFNNLAGNKLLMQQIKDGLTEEQIKATWQKDLNKFNNIRKQYLIYAP